MNNKDALMVELYNQSAENRTYGVTVTALSDATGMINATAHSTLAALVTMGWVEVDVLNDVISGKPKKSAWLTPDGWAKVKQLAGAEDVAKVASERAESKHDQANNASENNELIDATIINEDTIQANSDDNCMNCTQDSCDSCDEAKPIPLPQYNPDDVAFKKSDTMFWYTVDGIKEVFETSSDAIAAAHDYVATHTMSTTIRAVASKPHAIIKPVITTQLEYV